ncbi:caspase family protein [Polynucleobacter sp. VK25]|uniref:caspase family protein n=1 Tax=Polynucleobacter sp. VK25 TaxID=1758398 RepID=UPI001BFCFF9D|nr:caspase family protein [Polynucleobacter sp. VK25]QWD67738.1 caspase family protein [Polynucleobacter sp. VK25]
MSQNNKVFILDRRAALKTYGALIAGLFLNPKSVFASDVVINGPRSGLIIGNSKYPDSPLTNPANDAAAISKELNLLGFNTSLLMDASLKNLKSAIQKYTDQLNKEKSVGLFYYAGHGVQLGWRNYLVPVDAEIDRVDDIPKQAYELNVMLAALTKAQNPMNIIILDACRDNPFGKKMPIEQKGLSQFDAPPNSVLCYATAPGNVASDGSGTNGLFTENLLREMRNPTAKIEDVMKRVRLNVRLASKGQQIPWESTSLENDFYFNSKGVDPQYIEAQVKETLASLKPPPIQAPKVAVTAPITPVAAPTIAAAAPTAPVAAPTIPVVSQVAIEAQPILSAPTIPVADVTKKASDEEKERRFKEELALWEKAAADPSPKLVEDYLQKYPDGSFSQLAQVRLDQLLAKKGEKKVQVVSSAANPFSKGSASIVGTFSVGDSYSFEVKDLLTELVKGSHTDVVTEVSEQKITFNQGERIIDSLGNDLKSKSSRFLSPAQFYPAEFEVGNKWNTRYGWVLGNGVQSEIQLDFVIKNRSEFKSKLGLFNAYEVVGMGYAEGGSRFDMKYLIDPDKCSQPLVFEMISTNRRNNRRGLLNRVELIAYSQKKVKFA